MDKPKKPLIVGNADAGKTSNLKKITEDYHRIPVDSACTADDLVNLKVLPSITWYKQYTERSGAIEERSRPCYSNNFIVYDDGRIAFDAHITEKAKEELLAILNDR